MLRITCMRPQLRIHDTNDTFINLCSPGVAGTPVFYAIMRGPTAETNKYNTFTVERRIDNDETWADILVNKPLDFERNTRYRLTVRAEVRG